MLPKSSKTGAIRITEAASGRLVYYTKVTATSHALEINDINLAQGLYICQITSDDGISKQFKLVHIK